MGRRIPVGGPCFLDEWIEEEEDEEDKAEGSMIHPTAISDAGSHSPAQSIAKASSRAPPWWCTRTSYEAKVRNEALQAAADLAVPKKPSRKARQLRVSDSAGSQDAGRQVVRFQPYADLSTKGRMILDFSRTYSNPEFKAGLGSEYSSPELRPHSA